MQAGGLLSVPAVFKKWKCPEQECFKVQRGAVKPSTPSLSLPPPASSAASHLLSFSFLLYILKIVSNIHLLLAAPTVRCPCPAALCPDIEKKDTNSIPKEVPVFWAMV